MCFRYFYFCELDVVSEEWSLIFFPSSKVCWKCWWCSMIVLRLDWNKLATKAIGSLSEPAPPPPNKNPSPHPRQAPFIWMSRSSLPPGYHVWQGLVLKRNSILWLNISLRVQQIRTQTALFKITQWRKRKKKERQQKASAEMILILPPNNSWGDVQRAPSAEPASGPAILSVPKGKEGPPEWWEPQI